VGFVNINPRYREMLLRQGLDRAEQFFALPNVIVSGHPDRHVARVTLGSATSPITAFLKREHRVRWKERFLNACAGYGLVSKSEREAKTLAALDSLPGGGVGCPEWIACGEDEAGKAFLLVRALPETSDLRVHLERLPACARRSFINRLGQTLADLHNAGFDHPDLYAKHVLVGRDGAIYLLDWQRSRRQSIGWRQRWRDLAALNATLSESLMSDGDRLTCLRAYLRTCRLHHGLRPEMLMRSLFEIARRERSLLSHRRIREMRRPLAGSGEQSLVWVEGESLCMTRAFWDELDGATPEWLRPENMPTDSAFLEESKALASGRVGWLARRRETTRMGRLWAWFTGKTPVTSEQQQASLLFRLERHGVAVPRLLAFGQSFRSWQADSFLLVELPDEIRELGRWLHETPPTVLGGTLRERRRQIIRQAGVILRRLHEAGVTFDSSRIAAGRDRMGDKPGLLFVDEEAETIVCGAIGTLVVRRRRLPRHMVADLLLFRSRFGSAVASRTDELRFLLTYLGLDRVMPAARTLIAKLRHEKPHEDRVML
jgi:tRNA A-37 threonylcarbamoyl transferase component Bud32